MTPTTPQQPQRSHSVWKPLAMATIGIATLVTSGIGVLATLQAEASNVTPQAATSGTLKLALSNNGAGFSQGITNMAPGDTVNRYVTLENTGTLDGKTLTLQTAATGTANLINDGASPSTTKALTLAITACTVAWAPTTGECDGTTSSLLTPIVLSSAATAQTLISGAVNSGDNVHLKVSIVLPDQDETTVNGVLPTNTVQGGSVNLTHTFGISQRNIQTTNS